MERTRVLQPLMSRSRFLTKQYSELATYRGVGCGFEGSVFYSKTNGLPCRSRFKVSQ